MGTGQAWTRTYRWLLGGAAVMVLASATIAIDPPAEHPPANSSPQQQPEGEPRDGGRRRAQASSGMMNVEVSMKVMSRSARRLQDQLRDATKRDENIALIIDMQRGCVMAKSQPLPQSFLKDVTSEARKAELTQIYAAGLRELLRELVELEQSVVDGKLDDAASRLAKVGEMRDRVHKAMGMEE